MRGVEHLIWASPSEACSATEAGFPLSTQDLLREPNGELSEADLSHVVGGMDDGDNWMPTPTLWFECQPE